LFVVLLREAGYAVTAVADGEAGWKLLLETGYHLVVTDYELPQMSGGQLIRQIRTLPHPPRSLLMSARFDAGALARQCEADAVFQKGAPLGELLSRIAALC
jgi:DNA-binding response OmpR family regulator